MTKRDAALALAKQGFRVFPIQPNSKLPAFADWPVKATSDPAKVASWWSEAVTHEPSDHNIGILCDNLLVVDFEGKTKGFDALQNLNTFTARFGLENLRHLVDTPSGGYHAYMRLPEGVKVANTAKKIALGVDTRSFHGYVLAPGSSINGKSYEWVESIPDGNSVPLSLDALLLAPQSLIDACGKPLEKATLDLTTIYNLPVAIAAAMEYLKTAPPSIQGVNGNSTAFAVAARVRDFAISPDAALDLMLGYWNERSEPPWDPCELDPIIQNAYRYAKNSPHAPGSEFEAVTIPQTNQGLRFTPLAAFDPSTLPPRKWIVDGLLARGYVTILASAPGAGKTQYLAQLALSIAHSNPQIANRTIAESTPVWFFNAEDDLTELKRRLGAAMRRFDLDLSNGHAVGVSSGVETPLKIATFDQQKGVQISRPAIDTLVSQLLANRVGVLIVDPFAELHSAPENDNGAMRAVTAAFRDIAQRANCAVLIAAHTRKQPGMAPDGSAGNQDALRGAGSQNGVARIVFTLVGMSAKEGKQLKVPESERSKYQRLDIAKGNITPNARGTRPDWLKWESVALGNGDAIGVLIEDDLSKFASRVETEGEAGGDFEENVGQHPATDRRIKAIYDTLRSLELPPDEFHYWSALRIKAAELAGVTPGRGGTMDKLFATFEHKQVLDAGGGKELVIRKLREKGTPAKVMWRNSGGAESAESAESAENPLAMLD